MPRIPAILIGATLALASGLGPTVCPAQSAVDAPVARVPGTATIEGKVVYQSDSSRPWRLGRYYIKSAKTGELAEAVVAVSRRGLKASDPDRPAETWTVDQKDFQFTPETSAIRVGDQVRFLNNDTQVHNVQTTSSRHSFNVNMPAGGEHTEKFSYPGGVRQPYRIGCIYHAAMRAWVFVFDHPWYQITGKDGLFQLNGVPPGEYRLEVAHPAGDLRASQTIQVAADETLKVEFRLSPDDRIGQKK